MDTKYCAGCRDDFYNGKNEIGVAECWLLKDAEVVRRWRIGWWTRPDEPGAFTEVETHHCNSAPGRYSNQRELPDFAVGPVRLESSQ